MKFEVFTDWHESASATHLVGELDISYAELVDLFGPPGQGDGYKVDAEWIIVSDDGTCATIYNYKTGRSYLGAEGQDVENIRDWHVGGHDENALKLVQQIITTGEKPTALNLTVDLSDLEPIGTTFLMRGKVKREHTIIGYHIEHNTDTEIGRAHV